MRRRCAVDTGRKFNVHKTFRRRPGRLLNVLCTFNLRPLSTGWYYMCNSDIINKFWKQKDSEWLGDKFFFYPETDLQ